MRCGGDWQTAGTCGLRSLRCSVDCHLPPATLPRTTTRVHCALTVTSSTLRCCRQRGSRHKRILLLLHCVSVTVSCSASRRRPLRLSSGDERRSWGDSLSLRHSRGAAGPHPTVARRESVRQTERRTRAAVAYCTPSTLTSTWCWATWRRVSHRQWSIATLWSP